MALLDSNSSVSLSSGSAATKKVPELSSADASVPHRRESVKRKTGNGNMSSVSIPSKRPSREKLPFQQISSHSGPCTRARLTPSNQVEATATVDSTFVQSCGVSAPDAMEIPPESSSDETKVVKQNWQVLEDIIDREFEGVRSRDATAHVVPVHSGWFSWTKVHSLEEKTLTSFFSGNVENRTADNYVEIRNWIMRRYHFNPNKNVDETDLLDLCAGDLGARKEVMGFLDHWGLINFHPFLPDVSAAPESPKEEAPSFSELYRFDALQSYFPALQNPTQFMSSRLLPETPTSVDALKPEGTSVEYHCNSCSADCSKKRYHCQKQADFDLCRECFINGKFDIGMELSDFILMDSANAQGSSTGKWTEQENLLLLEALELYKVNWNEISEHVATKTKDQCMLHFIKMSIDDTYLNCDDEDIENEEDNSDLFLSKESIKPLENSAGDDANQESAPSLEIMKRGDAVKNKTDEENVERGFNDCFALKALREAFEAVGCLEMTENNPSFAEAGNPVMVLAAFLVRVGDADLATALAHSSLKSLSEASSPAMDLATRHCFLLEDPPPPNEEKELSGAERGVTEDDEPAEEPLPPREEAAAEACRQDDGPDDRPSAEAGEAVPITEAAKSETSAAKTSDGQEPTSATAPPGPEEETEGEEVQQKTAADKKDSADHHRCGESVKRAAVTAVAAAAVKARVLAGKEEDRIRELCASLVEKQLYKLEKKVEFFGEMEKVIGKVREQLDGWRQKLHQERAQIIAAGLGYMAASSSSARGAQMTGMHRTGSIAGNGGRPPHLGVIRPPPLLLGAAGPVVVPCFPPQLRPPEVQKS